VKPVVADNSTAAARTVYFFFFVVVVGVVAVAVACVGSLTDFVTAKRERSLIVGIDADMILDEWDIYGIYTVLY